MREEEEEEEQEEQEAPRRRHRASWLRLRLASGKANPIRCDVMCISCSCSCVVCDVCAGIPGNEIVWVTEIFSFKRST